MKRKSTHRECRIKRNRPRRAANAGPKALAGSIAGFCRVLAVSAITALGTAGAGAATFTWDPNQSLGNPDPLTNNGGLGGSGIWDLSNAFWWNGLPYLGGATDTAWTNPGTPNDAIFGTAGGTVDVDAAVNVGSLTFNVSGYTLNGAGVINLSGGSRTITVNNSSTVFTNTARISTFLSGSGGFTKAGVGTLSLEGDSSGSLQVNGAGPFYAGLTGGVTISGGTLILNYLSSGIAPASAILKSSNNLTFTNTSQFIFAADSVGNGGPQSMALSTLTFSGGEGTVYSQPAGLSDNAVLTFSSLALRAGGATGYFKQDGTIAATRKIVLTAQGAGFIDPGIFFFANDGTFKPTGYAWYDKTSAGNPFVRSINYGPGANTDANTFTQGASTTGIGAVAGNHVQVTGNITGQGNLSIATLNLNLGGVLPSDGIIQNPGTTLTLNNAGILKTGGGSATISGGIISGGSSEFVIRVDGASDSLIITSVLTNTRSTGQAGVTKSGDGSLLLNAQTAGALTFTGTTTTSGTNTLVLANAAPGTLTNGMVVNGPGIPTGTMITSVSGSTVTLNNNVSATSSLVLSYAVPVDSTLASLALTPAQAGTLSVGQIVTGANITPNTTITGINTATGAVTLSTLPLSTVPLQTVSFGGSTVAFGNTKNSSTTTGVLGQDQSSVSISSNTLTLLSTPAVAPVPGMSVSGTQVISGSTIVYIAPGTTVTAVSGTTVTLSQPAIATTTPIINNINALNIGNNNNTFQVTNAQTASLYVGQEISLPGAASGFMPAGTVITAVGGANSGSAGNALITLSNPVGGPFTTYSGANAPNFGGWTMKFGETTLVIPTAVASTLGLLVGSTVTDPAGQIPANTVVTGISTNGSNTIISLSNAMTGITQAEFVTFGGATQVGINSAYGGSTLVNGGKFAVGAAGLPAGGSVTVAGGAEFAAVSSIIPSTNSITITGVGSVLSAAGTGGGFAGTITTGANAFELKATDFNTLQNANLNISGPIVGTGTMTIPQNSLGVVTLSGNNVGFTGPIFIETSATLDIARLNSLQGNLVDLSGTLILGLDGVASTAGTRGTSDGTGAPQTLTLTSSINVSGNATIQPTFDGTAYGGYFTSARNKTVQIGSLTLGGVVLDIKNNYTFINPPAAPVNIWNGYGVEVLGTTFNNALNTFAVETATASNVVQGLKLTGKVTGGFGIIKNGDGTLVLANNSSVGGVRNDFGGGGAVIDILRGVVSVSSDFALGDPTNQVNLDWGGVGTVSALRATGTFATSRNILLVSSSNNAIEVSGGNTLTLNAPLNLSIGSESNGLSKGENGTLLLAVNNNMANTAVPATNVGGSSTFTIHVSVANALLLAGNAVGRPITGTNIAPGTLVTAVDTTTGNVTLDTMTAGSVGSVFAGAAWRGPITINAGVVRIANGNALGDGTSAITVVRTGAALQLTGGATAVNRLTMQGSGINSAGALESVSGSNTVSGQIVLAIPNNSAANIATTIGADSGSTLTITGGVTGTFNSTLTLNNAGTINVTTNPVDPAYSFSGLTNTTTTISNISDFSNLVLGQGIAGPFIPAGARITGINQGLGTITISAAATDPNGTVNNLSSQGFLNLVKFGAGTATLNVDSPSFVGILTVNQGTFAISGSGVTIGNPKTASNITVQAPSGTLVIDDSVGSPIVRTGNGTNTFTYTTTVGGGGNTITVMPAEAATLTVGETVFGVNVALNSTVSAINTTTGVVTLSVNTTGTASSQSIVFGRNRNLVLTGGTLIYNGNAAGSSEIFGALTTNRNATNVVASNPSGGASVLLTFGTLAINGDSNVDFQGAGLGVDGTNKITFLVAPGTTNSIIQRATLNGADFVSYNTTGASANTNGIQAFANYNAFNNIDSAVTTDTLSITADPIFTGPKTINALKISGGITATGAALQGNVLTLSAGAILSTSGNNAINFPVISFGAEGFVSVSSGSQLTMGGLLNGGGGFVKAGLGLLVLNAPDDRAGYANLSGQTLNGNFEVNAGEVRLGGGNNTLTPGQFLIVAAGARVDLNGTYQFVSGTAGDGASLQGNEGTYTNRNVGAPSALIFGTDNASRNFGGVIKEEAGAGAMSFLKAGSGTYQFYSPNTYSGLTRFFGGTNVLLDAGTLPNTANIVLNYGRLAFNDDNISALNAVVTTATSTNNSASLAVPNTSGLSVGMLVSGPGIPAGVFVSAIGVNSVTLTSGAGVAAGSNNLTFSANRVNYQAGIFLRGGSLVITNGRQQTETYEGVGAVSLLEGQNFFQSLISNVPGVTSATLSLTSLSRPAGSAATVRFADVNPASTGVLNFGALGTSGNDGRITIGTLNGTDTATAVSANNNLIGSWAVVDREFASYIPVLGVIALNTPGAAGYSSNFLNRLPVPGSAPTDNIRTTLSIPGLALDTTVNTLAVNTLTANTNAAIAIDLGGKKLTLAGGGIILAENNTNAALSQTISIQNGTVTSGAAGVGGDLYLHALNYGGVNNTFVVSAAITDNGAGAVRLVKASGSPDVAITSATADYLVITGTALNFGGSMIEGGSTLAGSNMVSVVSPAGITVGMSVTGNGLPANEFVTGISGNTVTITTGVGVTDTTSVLKNTYTGGTVINGGNFLVGTGGNIPYSPTAGITIGGGEVVGVGALIQDAGGVIDSRNTVTLNGLGALILSGNNTLQGLVFNDFGIGSGIGTAAPTVTTFRPVTALGTGTLTLGGGGITSTPQDPAAIATVVGRLDFGSATSTVTVNPYSFGTFTDFAPTTAGLILQGVINSSGTINKAGTGVLQLNAQEVFTGQLHVTAGTVQIGAGNAGSRFSQLNLDAAGRLNLAGQSTVIGSLAGSGTVTSTSGGPTLTVGFDGSNTTFSGQISRFSDTVPGAVVLVKVGAGTMTITSAQNPLTGSSGGVTVNGGGLTYSGTGKAFPSTVTASVAYNVNTGGTLTLDNGTTNITDRLGLNSSTGSLTLAGGTLNVKGFTGGTSATSETINTLTFNSGASTIRFTAGSGATTLTVNGAVSGQNGQDTGLVTGLGLGGSGNGSVNVVITGSMTLFGGGGGAGTGTISIRPDLLGDTAGGAGTGFLSRNSSNNLVPLNQASELIADMIQAAITGSNSNTGLAALNNATVNRIVANQQINSLTLLGAGTPALTSGVGLLAGVGTVSPSGTFAPTALPLTLTLGSGGVLALVNSSIGVSGAGVAIASGGVTEDYHVVGAGTTLNLYGSIVSATNGIVKADAGTLVFNAPQYYTGSLGTNGTTVNGGTLKLNGGNNTILVQPGASIASVYSLFMNGGTLDLNGNSQIVERISNNNSNAGIGGAIINSGAGTVTLTSATATGTTFSGSIGTGVAGPTNNAINFIKSGNSTLVLTSADTYTGFTVLRGGTLTLQDSGSLLQTSTVVVTFGTLLLNQAGLNPLGNPNPLRISAATPLVLNGGTLAQTSAGSVDSSATFNTVTLGTGASTVTQTTIQNAGSSSLFSIGSLAQNSIGATVNFASGGGTLGGGGLNNNQVRITAITPIGGLSSSPDSLLSNGVLPGWMTVNGSDFAGYLTNSTGGSQGIGAIGTPNFPAYSALVTTATVSVPIPSGSLPLAISSNNLSIGGTTLAVAGRAVNSLAVRAPGAATEIPINKSTDTLSIFTGGFLSNTAQSVVLDGGHVTAGSLANAPAALYLTASSTGTTTINSQIVNNGNQTFAANADGISNVIMVGSTSGLVQGQYVSSPLITPATTGNTVASNNVITLSQTSGITVGMAVSGPGIPAGEFVTAFGPGASQIQITTGTGVTGQTNAALIFSTPIVAITGLTSFTIGQNTTTPSFRLTAVQAVSSVTTAASNSITVGTIYVNGNVAALANVAVGMYVTGPGIPAGTTVTALGSAAAPTTIALSNAATVSISPQTYFTQVGSARNFLDLPNAQATTLTAGMTVTGTNVPSVFGSPTLITSFGAPNQFVNGSTRVFLNNTETGNLSTQLIGFGSTLNFARIGTYVAMPSNTNNNSASAAVNNNTGLVVGMPVSGPGIQAGTVIGSINGTSITLNDTNIGPGGQVNGNTLPAQAANNGINLTYGTAITVGNGTTGAVSLVKTGTGTITLAPQLVMNGSPTNGGVAVYVPTTAGLAAGMTVTGSGIPGGATIASITGPFSYNLSANATSAAGAQLTYGPGTSGISLTDPVYSFSNFYTGGTFVNQGTLNLGGLAGSMVIPGDLTISGGATVTMLTNAQQIASAGNVTILGTGTLNLVGANTLATLTFTSNGGTATPTVALGTGGTLTLTGGLTVVNDNLSFTPTISGTNSTLVLPNNTITVSGGSPVGLTLPVLLAPAGALVKAGIGSVVLSGANTFATGVSLNAGSIILGASSTPTSGSVTSGPVGTGTVNMADGTALLSDGTLRTIANAVNIAASATFGPLAGNGAALAGNGVTLTGPVKLTGGGAHTITVPDLLNVTTISGILNGSDGSTLSLTKAGTGTLILSNGSNSYLAPNPATNFFPTTITVNGGVLKLGAITAVPLGLKLSVAQGAAYDLSGNTNQFLSTLSGAGMVTNSSATTATSLFVGGTSSTDVTTNVNATFDGVLAAATTGNLSFTKVGLGRQTLTGVNTYTGTTTVYAGSLIVNGSLANSVVSVLAGATLGGTGTIGNGLTPAGSVTVSGGGTTTRGIIDLTTNAAIGNLSLATAGTGNALTLGGISGNPSLLVFDTGTNSTDKIAILGTAALKVNAGGGLVNLNTLGALAPGNYALISYASTAALSTNFTAGTVNGGAAGSGQTFANGWTLSVTPSFLRLTVPGGPSPDLYWKGNLGAAWNTSANNWTTDAAGLTPSTTLPDSSTFVHFAASSPSNLSSTTLGQDFTIGQLQFEAATSGAIGIGGTNKLTLNGNMVKLNGSGAVTFSMSGAGGLIVGNTEAWTNQSASDITISTPVTASAGNQLLINSTGAGKIILNGNNSALTGDLIIAGSGANTALQLGPSSTNPLGPTNTSGLAVNLTVNSGVFDMNGVSATVSSLLSAANSGIIKNTNASAIPTLTVYQSAATTYSGFLQDNASPVAKMALLMDGGGSLTLITATNTYSGGTTIQNSTLRMGNGVSGSENQASLGTGPVTIKTGGVLNLAPGSATVYNLVNSFSLDGGAIQSAGGNQHLATGAGAQITVTGNNGTITPSLTGAQDVFVDGKLTGSGDLNVGNTGSGKVILTNNTNDYSGTLTSSAAGNLQIAGSTANSAVLASAALVNNGNGLTFASNVTSATFGSLAGSGNFSLQNASSTALTLTVGNGAAGDAPGYIYTGIISNSTTAILGNLIKAGSGTLTLAPSGGNANTYHGTTTVNAGTLRVNSANATNSVTGTGAVTVFGGTLGGTGVIQGGNNASPGSVTLNSGTFLDPGLTPLSFGTLRIGVQSGKLFDTQLSLMSGSTYNFDVGAGAGSQDRVLVIGQASIGGSSLAIHSLSTPDQGSYTLLSTTGNVNGTFSTITGLPSGYSVIYQTNSVILQLTSSGFIMTTPGNLQVITGATLPFTVTVQNPAATGGASVNFTATSGMNTAGSVSPAVVVSAQSSAPATGLSFDATALAPGAGKIGTFTGFNNGANAQQGSVTVDVLDHASFSTFTGGTLTLPNVREGYSGPQTSTNSLSVTNDPGFRVNLKGSAGGSIGNFSVSDVNAVAPGSSGSITASLTAGLTASSTPYSQNFTYQFADDSTLVGNNPNLAPTVTVTATVSVYNGQGVWGASPSGSWGTFSNWTLPGGYPGLDGVQSLKDTATIGSGLTGTLALDDGMGNPVVTQLNALNFNGTSGTVAPGAGGSITLRNDGGVPTPVAPTITVTGGTPTISAPIFLQNNTTITTTGANDQMTISGNITGTGAVGSTATGLTVTGLGTTTLSGTNTYPGKTTVNGGTLSVLSEASLGAVPGPTVPDQISISNGSTLAFTGNTTLATSQGITVGSGSNTLAVATSQTVVVSGQISGTASSTLIKTGTGTLDVRSNTGNGVLGGGTPGTLTLMAGTLAPNVGAPVAISMGNLNFNGGTLAIDVLGLAGQGNTNGNDYLNAEAVTFNKATPLTINLGMFVPTPGDQFTFLSDGTGLGATFNTDPQTHQPSYFTVNGNPAGPMQTFQVGTSFFQILYNQGALGGDMVLSTVVPVPEAGSAVLLLGGVGVVGLLRLRRRRNVPLAA